MDLFMCQANIPHFLSYVELQDLCKKLSYLIRDVKATYGSHVGCLWGHISREVDMCSTCGLYIDVVNCDNKCHRKCDNIKLQEISLRDASHR